MKLFLPESFVLFSPLGLALQILPFDSVDVIHLRGFVGGSALSLPGYAQQVHSTASLV